MELEKVKLCSLQIDVSKRALNTELEELENKCFNASNDVPTAEVQHTTSSDVPTAKIQPTTYYFEKQGKTFEDARENCKEKGGKLYEPKDAVKMKEIVKTNAGNTHNTCLWIGITDIASEGNYVYDSIGQSINFSPTWYSSHGAFGRSYNCICTGTETNGVFGKLADVSCSGKRQSICEL